MLSAFSLYRGKAPTIPAISADALYASPVNIAVNAPAIALPNLESYAIPFLMSRDPKFA